MRARCGGLALAVLLAGCQSAGPDYRRPATAAIERPTAQGPLSAAAGAAYSRQAPPNDWWRLYRDPVLDRLIAQALAANTDLRVAVAHLHRAGAGLALTEVSRQPQTRFEGGVAYDRPSAEEQLIPGGQALPSEWVYGLDFGVAYQLDLFGQVSRAIEAAQAGTVATRAALDAVRITVVANTTRAYFAACAGGEALALAQRLVALQAEDTALVRRQVAAGRAGRLALTRSSGQEDQVRATVPTLAAHRQLALLHLAALLGGTPAEIPAAAAACTRTPRLGTAIPVGDGAALLARRPDVRGAEAELHAATARIGVATADLYPKVVLGGSIGSAGLAGHFGDDDTLKFTVGPLIQWQFPNRSRARAEIAGAHAEAEAALARFDGTVLTALRETDGALTVYAQDLRQRALLAEAGAKARRALDDSRQLYAAGRIAWLPVLDAERTRVRLAQALAQADRRLADDQVALFLALGGGWQTAVDSAGGAHDTAAPNAPVPPPGSPQ